MKTITKYIRDNEFEASNESGNVVQMDMHERSLKKHQSPMELLLSAIAGCAAVDIVEMLKKKRKTVNSFSIISEGDRRTDYPKSFTDIRLKFILHSPDTNMEEYDKVLKLAVDKYCSVSATLKGSANLTYSGEIVKE